MFKPLPLLFLTIFYFTFSSSLNSQVLDQVNYRTYSGFNNNIEHPEWGDVGTHLLNMTGIKYADGYQAPTGQNRPNPRTISNALFEQPELLDDLMGLSDFCWVWGQFMDHDFGLTDDGAEPLFIQVPEGDPAFDPQGVGQAIIPMHRNKYDHETGTALGNPRRFENEISAYIDASAVYGSSADRANWLRTFEGGKLKMSTGNFLPYNTIDGEFDSEVDPDAPFMANATGISQKVFVAGDIRASENTLLLIFHTIFAREHNRQCDRLAAIFTDWTDEQIYQHARKIVGGLMQSVMYDEWIPAVGINLPAYEGYDASVNAQLSNVFTAAAFRVGHTLLSTTIQRIDEDGNEIPEGHLALRDAFFNPFALTAIGSVDPFLRGMGVQMQQRMDAKVIEDVRSFLFGQPGFGGLDLAAININRGRERGLDDYNAIRVALGLPEYLFFQQINTNPQVFAVLQSLYGSINQVDPWVGMVAEAPISGSIFGPTIHTILSDQFLRLRDGDRFFYLNDPILTDEEKAYIQQTTLRDIIMYNTGINFMQDNVFGAMPHDEICDHMSFTLNGNVSTANGAAIEGVNLTLSSVDNSLSQHTTADGTYAFPTMPYCDLDFLTPQKEGDAAEGVTTLDIIIIQKHILGVELLDSPYKMIAADVNKSGGITTIDLIRIRKVILGIESDFGDGSSWRFVLNSFEFEDAQTALDQTFPEQVNFSTMNAAEFNAGFIAVKMGDVNGSVASLYNNEQDVQFNQNNTAVALNIYYEDQELEAGEQYEIELMLKSEQDLEGFQFELLFKDAEILNVGADVAADYYAYTNEQLRFSWNRTAKNDLVDKHIRVTFKATENMRLADVLSLSTDFVAESYTQDANKWGVMLVDRPTSEDLLVLQNTPNPFKDMTMVEFFLPQRDEVNFTITNAAGQLVYNEVNTFDAGWQQWTISKKDLPATGQYFYSIKSGGELITKSLVFVRE